MYRSAVIDDLLEAADTAVAYVYFGFQERGQSTIRTIRSILGQWLARTKKPNPGLQGLYRIFRKKEPEYSDLVKCLKSSAELWAPCYVVFDALDEFEVDKEEENRLELLLELLGQLNTVGVKFYATSRPQIESVNSFFKDALNIAIQAHPDDLTNFVTKKLQKQKSLQGNEEMKRKVLTVLPNGADGV